ncbi:hypothetical protein MASR2M16_23420 [Thauera terpenica]
MRVPTRRTVPSGTCSKRAHTVAASPSNTEPGSALIHFSRTWNPAKEDQATDRAYRIGQTRDVHVHYPIVSASNFKTFDEKLHELLTWKRSLSQDMLNGAGELRAEDFADLDNLATERMAAQAN